MKMSTEAPRRNRSENPKPSPFSAEFTKGMDPNLFHNARNLSQNKKIKQGQRVEEADLGEIYFAELLLRV